MATPEDREDKDGGGKGWHVLESLEERYDIVRHLLAGDDQHGDGKGKGGIDESFEPGHLEPAQPEALEPRERIEIRW